MSFDLKQGVIRYINHHGVDATVALTGKPRSTVMAWLTTRPPGYVELDKMVAHDPEAFLPPAEAAVLPYSFPAGTRVALLMPSVRPIHLGVLKSVAALYERDKMQLFSIADNSYVRARNWCAQRFLDSGCEYSFWLDDDTVLPHGDVEYFRKLADHPTFPANFINLNPIARLMQTGKSLVGGCYFGRQPGGVAQFKEAYTSAMTNDAAHAGPRNVVDPVGWVGFGCTLVHRKVFEDILATQDIRVTNAAFAQRFGYQHKFFNHLDDESSEDVSFCVRAKQAGHQAFVDFAVMPLHLGVAGYTYHNTKKRPTSPVL